MIIDAHHHLWQPSRGDYGWLDARVNPAVAPIEREFLVEHYRQLAAENGIGGSVLVQAAQTVAETLWLLAQAHGSAGLIKGVVGWFDMAARDAPDVLSELARDPLLRGVRPMLQEIADVTWVLQPSLDPAFRALIEQDLAFDILIRPQHLRATLELLNRYPDLRAIVDHCGKPEIARGMWQPWAGEIRLIAQETSAYCKLSGLATEAQPGWNADDLRRYTDHVIDCFGPDRVAWGSDWPVMLLNADYPRWLDTARQLIAPLSAVQQERILSGNAASFYRLEV